MSSDDDKQTERYENLLKKSHFAVSLTMYFWRNAMNNSFNKAARTATKFAGIAAVGLLVAAPLSDVRAADRYEKKAKSTSIANRFGPQNLCDPQLSRPEKRML